MCGQTSTILGTLAMTLHAETVHDDLSHVSFTNLGAMGEEEIEEEEEEEQEEEQEQEQEEDAVQDNAFVRSRIFAR
jgi:hypothetical protein